jgi:uncharacterized protein YggE
MLKSKRAIGAGLIILVLAISILVFFALPRVNVTGTGTVEAYPDEVQLSFTVRSDDASAAKAAARNGASMSAVLEALASQGVRKSDVKTVGYWLSPVYDPYNYTMVTGYAAIHSLQVILTGDNITSVGTIIDAVVQAGVNQIDGVTFTFTDAIYDKLRTQAYQKAVQDAKEQANVIVGSLGGVILGVVSVSTGYQTPMPIYAQEMGGSMINTPMPSGTAQVTATVSITYLYI